MLLQKQLIAEKAYFVDSIMNKSLLYLTIHDENKERPKDILNISSSINFEK